MASSRQLEPLRRVEYTAQLGQLFVCRGIIPEEGRLVLGVEVDILPEAKVCPKARICLQPNQIFVEGVTFFVLGLCKVGVVESEPILGPSAAACHADALRPIMAGDAILLRVLGSRRIAVPERACSTAVFEDSPGGVGAGKGHDLLVRE